MTDGRHINIEELEQLAYDDNDAEAQCVLGYCYENGLNGLSEDKEKAFELYQLAAYQGEVNGIYNVAVCLGFSIGTGKARDAQGWLENIRLAAEKGFAPAQNDYGWAFECAEEKGFFDEKDDAKAFEWYMKSAMQGHQTGITNVIRCYEEGIGVQPDAEAAKEWKHILERQKELADS